MKDSIKTYGIPSKIYVDSGSPDKDEQLSLICGNVGIVLIHTPVRDGASKGKIERNFRTLRNRFLNVLDVAGITSIELLNQKLFDYIRQHNTTVHSATGETPAERYRRDLNIIKVPRSGQWLDECFMNRISRCVKNDATVTIDKVLYDVPMQFIRSRVQICYLPDDMEHAYIYHDKEKYFIRRTDKVENGKTKHRNTYAIDYGGERQNV